MQFVLACAIIHLFTYIDVEKHVGIMVHRRDESILGDYNASGTQDIF